MVANFSASRRTCSSLIFTSCLVIGTYDILMGKANNQEFIKLSIYIRLGFAAGTILLVIFGQMPASLILLGSVDALGSLWTSWALKSEVAKNN